MKKTLGTINQLLISLSFGQEKKIRKNTSKRICLECRRPLIIEENLCKHCLSFRNGYSKRSTIGQH